AASWAGIDRKSPQGSATTLVTDSPHPGNSATRAPRRYTGQHCRRRSRAEADDCPRPAHAYATFSSFTGDSWLLRRDRPATRTRTRLRKASLVGLGCSFLRTKPQMRPCTGRFPRHFAAMQRWPAEELNTPVIYGVHPVESA